MARVSVQRWVPMTIVVDGVTATIMVKRLTRDEFLEFEERWKEFNQPAPGLEDLAAEFGNDAARIAQAVGERERDLPPEDRAARVRERKARQQRLAAWVEDAVRAYCRAPRGELEIDGEAVETGGDIVAAFDSDFTFMFAAVTQIWFGNVLTTAQRKNFGSLFGSSITSPERRPVPAGPRPAPTAGSAEHSDSAASADVTSPIEAETPPATETTEP